MLMALSCEADSCIKCLKGCRQAPAQAAVISHAGGPCARRCPCLQDLAFSMPRAGALRRLRAGQKLRGDPWLYLSSLGVGTYLGTSSREDDLAATAAVVQSVAHGWNVIDSASNYRDGHGEVRCCCCLMVLILCTGCCWATGESSNNSSLL